ncbi:transglutaminaseTgpA domain-containing protein [Catenuloplanes japonicus]|uniref:transglutaminaseTgpA domain-containing protein n=1 Tax=Catenuloplanes japonicus TaxID=33876 RepID=UPI00052477F3|nr:transglutaminaseTgpA domain-containing protein [Catenuloplanes japonicus]
MSGRRRLGLVAAAATLMAAAPISTIYDRWTWLIQCVIAVGVVCGAATLSRSLRAPVWAQALAMVAGLLLITTWIFRSGEEILGVLPGPETFTHFADLATKAMEDMRSYAIPVPDRDGLLFLTVVGVGGVAIVVDLLTVGLRRPALAGLPMLAIYSVPVAIYPESVPMLPFVIGAVGYLWLLVADNVERVRRFGRRFTGDGRDVDVWAPSPLAAAGRRLAVVGVVAAVAIPLAVPTFSSGLLTRITQGAGGEGTGPGGGGTAGKVDLFASLSGQLRNTETVQYLTVTTNNPQPYYLRFGVADTLTPEGFRNQAPNGRPVTTEIQPPEVASSSLPQQGYSATVSITDRFDMPMLPVYANTTGTEGLTSGWFYDDSLQIVYSNRHRSRSAQYSFSYVAPEYTADALRLARELEPESTIRQQYTQLPELTEQQQAEVTRIVTQEINGATTQYDKARALYDFFSRDNGFTYSLQTESGSSGSDLLDFLDNKVGYCQQYATALAWLLREADIPARVAFGFTRGSATGAPNSYAITNQNAHAWTEVYFDGFGWVPFDATPAQSVPGSARGEWAPDVDASPAPSTSAAPTTSVAPGATSSVAPGQRPERDVDETTPGAGGPVTPQGPRWPWYLAASVIVLLALLAVPALLRSSARRRRTAPITAVTAAAAEQEPGRMSIMEPSPELEKSRSYAHAAWAEMLDTMVDFRVEVNPAETPRTTVQRLAKSESLTPEATAAATLLGSAEEHARYARTPLDGAGDLGNALSQLRQGLSVHATRSVRTRALLMPPSVLRRWKTTIGDRYASVIAIFGRWRDTALRLSPRRLLARSR